LKPTQTRDTVSYNGGLETDSQLSTSLRYSLLLLLCSLFQALKQQGNFSPIQAMKITCPWKISNKAWFICHDFPGFFFSCQSLAA
jgi:hypothetical protein